MKKEMKKIVNWFNKNTKAKKKCFEKVWQAKIFIKHNKQTHFLKCAVIQNILQT